MHTLRIEIVLSEAAMQEIDLLRGDYDLNEFMALCIEWGVTGFSDEANRVYREALCMTMLNRTKDFKSLRQHRTVTVREAEPQLDFHGSSRRMTAA